MKINQLFKSYFPDELFHKILNSFGFVSINEDHSFCKLDLERIETVRKIDELREEISKYYLPCKARLYVTNMDESKCITMFRQILRLQGLGLKSSQKYIKKRKTTFYTIQKKVEEEKMLHNIKIENEKTIIQFL